MRCWDFECWTSHALYSNCFQLSVCAIRYYSHLARPCVVFHKWVGKTCGMLTDRSHDAWLESWHRLESGHTTGVVFSNWSWAYDWSHVFRLKSGIRPESCLPTGVASFDRSRVFQPELGIRSEPYVRPELWDTCIISMYNGYYMIWNTYSLLWIR
jgi:hypothetical protein